MTQRIIQILETYYDEARDLVQWSVKNVSSDKRLVLCWPGRDLGPAVGVNAELTPELIRQFCQDIQGKTINLVAEADVTELEVKDFKEHSVLDKYPYHEVVDSLQEQQPHDASKDETKQPSGYFSLLRQHNEDHED
tara:strand:- start:4978 stop:5385 length:408 start_codon:yes stop_codon:yes gene_type:complete